jgi:uncharacterized protein YicC (UPF0701 family)
MNTMKKQLYTLNINPALQSVMPPLQDNELELLTQILLAEGCREPLVIWNGMVVDGHTRYRICHASVERVLLPIEDAVKELLSRVTEGEATTKMIIMELNKVSRMIEKVRNDA